MSSFLFAGGVACAYVASVIGLHRLNVWRQRKQAGGFRTLDWLDWDTLLEGLLPPPELPGAFEGRPFGGGPAPSLLSGRPEPAHSARRELLSALVQGISIGEEQLSHAFSGGQLEWLATLRHVSAQPERALERLKAAELSTAAELYLREYLRLSLEVNPLNLELAVFSTKRHLTQGLERFGEHPALFFVRARASARIGFNQSAVDDLARAVYFSRQAPFYLLAVTETPYIEEVRPALVQQCRRALDATGDAVYRRAQGRT